MRNFLLKTVLPGMYVMALVFSFEGCAGSLKHYVAPTPGTKTAELRVVGGARTDRLIIYDAFDNEQCDGRARIGRFKIESKGKKTAEGRGDQVAIPAGRPFVIQLRVMFPRNTYQPPAGVTSVFYPQEDSSYEVVYQAAGFNDNGSFDLYRVSKDSAGGYTRVKDTSYRNAFKQCEVPLPYPW